MSIAQADPGQKKKKITRKADDWDGFLRNSKIKGRWGKDVVRKFGGEIEVRTKAKEKES